MERNEESGMPPVSKQLDLKDVIDKCFRNLQKEKDLEGYVVIPPQFFYFVNSPLLFGLISTTIDYCRELLALEKKHDTLAKEAKTRGLDPPKILPNEREKLLIKARDVSLRYTLILTKMERFNNMQTEQNFFETMIYFISKVTREIFDKDDGERIDEEIQRLFKTNAFNIVRRRNLNDKKLRMFPCLKDNDVMHEDMTSLMKRIARRVKVPKSVTREDYYIERTEIKPCCYKVTPMGALESRSPLISIFMPSAADSRRQFLSKLEEKKAAAYLTAEKRTKDSITRIIQADFLKKNQKDNSFWL